MDFYKLTNEPIEAIYQIMGSLVAETITDDWKSATVYAEINEDDNGLTYGRYVPTAAPDTLRSFKTGYRWYFIFDELRRRFHKPGHAPWVKARFMLYPDGHFDLDFTYPDETTR